MEDPAQSVCMPPGSRTVTLMPSGPTSFARTSENPPTAHLGHYKLTSLGAVDEAAALVARVLPALRMAEAREFVATLASLAGSLWQIANPAPALAELYASDPALAQACVDLAPRLRRTAEILLAGLKAAGDQGQSS